MRAALYARYSTDLQRPTSIEDQVRLARARADSANLEVVAVHSDEGVSGSVPIEQRPGGRALMADAAALRFDVLILEALDRFSRNLVDQERVVRRLEFDGIRIIGVVDGYDSAHEGREMMRAVRGSFNEQLLRDIAKKTHRGLRGQIARGYHAGGLSFGYRSVIAGLDAKGEPVGHRLEIEPAEADVVRWLFARYAEGLSCQRLVADLNGRHVPAPRGGTWAVSALYGSPNKGRRDPEQQAVHRVLRMEPVEVDEGSAGEPDPGRAQQVRRARGCGRQEKTHRAGEGNPAPGRRRRQSRVVTKPRSAPSGSRG